MSGLQAAVGLLTRVPMARVGEDDLVRSVGWIPVVGGLIGLVIALVYALTLQVLPSLPAAGIAITFGIVLTGAFHEDGLADVADGFVGGADPEDVIRIMRDPVHGTYGTIALVASFVLRVTAVATLGAAGALIILPTVHALSRSAGIGVMAILPAASDTGMGAALAAVGRGRRAGAGILAAIGIGLLTLGLWTIAFAMLAGIGAAILGWLALQRIQGYTGDVLGAVEQVGEITLMLLGSALMTSGVVPRLWWS